MLKKHPELIKPSYQKISPYIAGKNAELLKRDLKLARVIKLASNENPLGTSPLALQAASQSLTQSHLYPDSNGTFLKNTLSKKFNIPLENIILSSGSDSLFHILAQAFINPDDEVIISEFAFASYEIATLANQGKPIIVPAKEFQHDLPGMLNAISKRTKLIFLANPNNPTGTWFTHESLTLFLKHIPSHVLIVLDEAYFEYMQDFADYPKALELRSHFPNLIISRTFSKAYGLAGLRIAYAFADPSIVTLINTIRSPFTISTVALAAAEVALHDNAFIQKTVQHNTTIRSYFLKELALLGLENIAPAGNFVTVNFGDQADTIFQELLQKGIILRPLKNYNMPNFLRITLGLEDELHCLVKELKGYYT